MIDKLYGKYFQKSRSFLYPALGIKRNATYTPLGTFLSIEGIINPEDIKLVVTFIADDSEEFKTFENQMLIENPLFEEKIETEDYNIYVFNFMTYESDWFNVILGKYSKLSTVLKRAIKVYYGENSSEYKYIESYLFPEKYFETYAKLLNVDVSTLKKIGELCDPCDLDKEALKIPAKYLDLIKENH